MTSGDDVPPLRLSLLGGFALVRDTEEFELPMSAQRLVALLSLRERPLSRTYLSGVLWPNCPAERSLAGLRTALWRANHCSVPVIAATGVRLRLRPEVQVDVRLLTALGCAGDPADSTANAWLGELSRLDLSLDLLPDWYEDWLIDDRERVRQLRLHALERMTDELILRGRYPEAIQAALATVRLEPLRETAHAALIRAHLAEGNRSEALRQFSRCRALLQAELAVEPSESIRYLISAPALVP